MEIQELHFVEGRPTTATFTISLDLLAHVTRLCGQQPVGGPTAEFYGAATQRVFNRYWDDGVHGYLNGDED